VETELDAFVLGEFSENLQGAHPLPGSVSDEELADIPDLHDTQPRLESMMMIDDEWVAVPDRLHADLQYGFGKLCLFLCTILLTFVTSLSSDDELMDDSTYFTDGRVADSRYDLVSCTSCLCNHPLPYVLLFFRRSLQGWSICAELCWAG